MRPLLMMLAKSALNWRVLASAVLIAVMAIGLGRASVTAETPVYADPAGACNGLTPCFTTVQEAVDEVDTGGEVFVFPGAYAESVILVASVSDINAGSLPTLSLTTVDAAGTPTPGTATVDPASGPAFATLGSSFPGDITMNGFIVTSLDDDGIFLDVVGDAVIANMTADTCKSGEPGCLADIDGGNGFQIDAGGDVTISNSIANGNGADGFDPNAKGNLTICNSTANDNADQGMELDLAGDLFLNRVTVMNNGKEGIEIDGTKVAESADLVDNVTIQNSRIEGNVREGIVIDDVEDGGAHLINGNIIALNGEDGEAGLLIKAKDDVDVLANVNAEGNWWGDASGPTHPDNSAGTGDGDEIVDSASDGSGTVEFDPWVDSGSASVGPVPSPIAGTGPCYVAAPQPAVGGAVQTGEVVEAGGAVAAGNTAAAGGAELAVPAGGSGGFSWGTALAAGVGVLAALALVGVGVIVGARRLM